MLHGSEFFSLEVIRRLVETVDPSELKGTILAVPVGNPVAFERHTRNTPDESDAADLNRVFPGFHTWIAEQLARTITDELLAKTDYVIDFHQGGWGHMMGTVAYGTDFTDQRITKVSRELARAFGYHSVRMMNVISGFPGAKACGSYAGEMLGIPNIVVEIGGCGFAPSLEEEWTNASVTGVLNVLRHLQMLPGSPSVPRRYLVYQKMHRVNPRTGGYLVPQIEPDRLMTEVSKGDLLGLVISPYSFEVIEELISPCNGAVIMNARAYPVRPGDWAFGIADMDDGVGAWVED
jgi:predicted deacylase